MFSMPAKKEVWMKNKEFNLQRYNRKKQYYRLSRGIQEMVNHMVLNLIWIPYVIGAVYVVGQVRKLMLALEVYPMLTTVFYASVNTALIILLCACAIGIIQYVGYIFSVRDEADMEIVFGENRTVKNQTPILVYKKKDKKTGVTSREFYTTIPLERWRKKENVICDIMNIHMVCNISYGGKKKNKGNRIHFESLPERNITERKEMYDDI